jgi:hypothetical protein
MESPLSFDASENFRKKLLSINLPPYKTKGGPSFEENVARSELILVNYSVSDSPSVEDIGKQQERVLITKNQYGPNDPSYGDTVDINKDQNFKSPEGNYNLSKTIQSQLEKNGDFQETLLYIKNIYVPTVDGRGYGISRYDINNDLQKGNKNDVYDITDTFNNELEQVGNQQEILLKTKNTYFPGGPDYGDTSYDINDDEVIDTTGFGNYLQRGLDPFWVSNNNVSVVGSVEFFDNTIKNKFRLIVPNGVEYEINNDDEGLFTTPGNGLFVYDNSTQSQQVIESNALSIKGNQQEAILYQTNIYKPVSTGLGIQYYGNVNWDINYDIVNTITTGFGEYDDRAGDLNWVNQNYVTTKGNEQENIYYQINLWKPQLQGNDFYGSTRYDIWNAIYNQLTQGGVNYDQTASNLSWIETNYVSIKAQQTLLFDLAPLNIYTPAGTQYGSVNWDINYNINNTLTTGSGDYEQIAGDVQWIESNALSNIASPTRGDQYNANQYKPTSYGSTNYDINNDTQGVRESFSTQVDGEYDKSTDAQGSLLETVYGKNKAIEAYNTNLYKPEDGQNGYGTTQYDVLDDEKIQNLNQPGSYDKGEYDAYNQNVANNSNLEINAEVELGDAYVKNTYVPETGYGNPETVLVEDLPTLLLNQPYSNDTGVTPRTFISSFYTPYAILIQEDPQGDSGKISQDSSLASFAAERLKKEFAYRVTAELLQQTLDRVNFLNTSFTQPDGFNSTQLSVKPNTDPFDILGLATGNIPLIERNWSISVPDLIIGKTLNFAAKLAGLYSPYSFIPGEYFDYPSERFLTQVTDNPVSALFTKPLTNTWNSITSLNIKTASELFLANTGSGTQKELFTQLKYNTYRPDYKLNSFRDPNVFAPDPNFYIGSRKTFIQGLVPEKELPKLGFGNRVEMNVYGSGEFARIFEGDLYESTRFGVESINDFDGGDLQGGFTWGDNFGNTKPQIGKKVGPGGVEYKSASFKTKSNSFQDALKKNISGNLEKNFTKGSILDFTQRIVEVANDIGNDDKRQRHVGTAINQISKVFNDGYTEMTKGSRVVKWRTKNSVDKSTIAGGVPEGLEYCRVWTKDDPYVLYGNLQKTSGNIRKYKNSVFDNTYNLNIGPMRNSANGDSTNIFPGGVKKYMISLENLAWRTSNRPGLTYEDLALCERGPNGGRIMWFPPYDVSFDESVSTDWNPNTFLGRTEPIYTYTNTKRSGKLSFKIVVDHPCILDKLVAEELKNVEESKFTRILDSFFAGCLEYDPYELANRYSYFTLKDIQEVLEVTKGEPQVIRKLVPEVITPPNVTSEEIVEEPKEVLKEEEDNTNIEDFNKFKEDKPVFYYEQAKPRYSDDGKNTDRTVKSAFTSYDVYYAQYLETDVNKSISSLPQIPAPSDGGGSSWKLSPPITVEDYYIRKAKNLNGDTSNKLGVYPDSSNLTIRKFINTDDSLRQSADFYKKYIDISENSIKQFFSYARNSYSKVDEFLQKTLDWLDGGNTLSWNFKATCSAGFLKKDYNINLSYRRVSSFVQYMEKYTTQSASGKKLSDFFSYDHKTGTCDTTKPLTFKLTFAGYDEITEQEQFKGINCSTAFPRRVADDASTDYLENRFSVNGMACRKITIDEIAPISKKTDPAPTPPKEEENKPEPKDNNPKGEDPKPEPKYVEEIVYPEPSYNGTIKKELTGKLVRKLLCECDYFEMLNNESPMIYNGLKEKLKYFHPAFHAITPEGLNKRLVFLQQCMRPGDTIPTVVETGADTTTLLYKDAFNSAFGAPPICVLRVGDFWHTKVVIDSLSLTYPKDGQWDINPEGIGLQPMIAEVSISFNFIGGHGLAEPVQQLQNALSFNFYANTEMYDERATQTEIVKGNYSKEDIDRILNDVGINDRKDRQNENDNGVPFGTIVERVLDIPNNSIKGTIEYKENINNFAKKYREYASLVESELKDITKKYGIGITSLFTDSRKYTTGKIGGITNSFLFGVSTKISQNLKLLENGAIDDVANDLCPMFAGMLLEDFKNLNKFSVKNYIKKLIKTHTEILKEKLEEVNIKITKKELELVKLIDQTNFIHSGKDGYKRDNGEIFIFDISGGTPSSVSYTSAYQELQSDVNNLATTGNTFYDKLIAYNFIPAGNNKFESTFNFDTFIFDNTSPQIDKGPENRFFMLFYNEILNIPSFVDDFIENAKKNAGTLDRIKDEDTGKWKTFLQNNVDFLKTTYEKSKKQINTNIEDLEKTEEYKFFKDETTFKPFDFNIKRTLSFSRQNPTNQTDSGNYKLLAPPQNVPNNNFNLKNKFTY